MNFFPLPSLIKKIDGKHAEMIWCYYVGTSFLEEEAVLKKES